MNELKKPKILVFSTSYFPFVGGAEVAVREIAKKLKDKFNFFIVTSRFDRKLPKVEKVAEGTIVRLGFGSVLDKYLLPILGAVWAGRRQGILFGLDISAGSLAPAILKFLHPKRFFVLNIQYGYGDERLAKGRAGLIGTAFRFMLSQADSVAAISNYLLNTAKDYGYKGYLEVIPNGVDFQNTQNTDFTNYKQNTKPKTIITTSRLVYKNGIDILIKAVAKVKEKIPDVKCLILGDGSEEKSLKSLAMQLNVSGNIEFLGNIDQEKIPEYLAGADVFVRPSRSEGLGISFLEAMAVGLPVITPPVGGIPDFLKDGETGLFCKGEDYKDLAEKILVLFRDESLARKIVENGRKIIEEKFLWNGISKKYENLFNLASNPKVLIATGIFPPDIGGPATYSKILLDELPKRGINAKILSFGSVRKLPKIVRHFAYFCRTLKMSRSADVIFAQDPMSVGLPAALVAKFLRKKFLLKIVGDYAWEQWQQSRKGQGVRDRFVTPDNFQREKFDFVTELRRKIQKFVARNAKLIITPSNYLKKIVGMWGVDSNKIRVIYNSFDSVSGSYEDFKNQANVIKKDLNLTDTKIIFSAGRLVPWKGFNCLIGIMPDILKLFPNARLMIVGDGPERQKLESQVKTLGLENKVIFTGSLRRYTLLMHCLGSDVFALNTAYEGFSHQILEAMELGRPVVTTNIGGNPEIVKNGENGFLVEFNDKEALKKMIVKLMKNSNLAEKFGRNAKIAAQQFTKERMINGISEVIKTL